MVEKERIDPWGSAVITDYGHVFKEFGLKEFDKKEFPLDHYLFERGIVIAHRDFGLIYDRIKKKQPFINMTGIACSGYMHFGHKMVIDLFKFFKEKGARNYLGVCDLDAFTSRPRIKDINEAKDYAVDNLADALAMGIDKKDVFVQSQEKKRYFEFTFELSKKITENMFRAIYGHLDIGKISAVILQMADILHPQLQEYEGRMPSITAIALDQDPHMRLVRDLSHSLPYNLFTPSSIYIRHQSGLKEGPKMSSSIPDSAVFLKDDPDEARKKIMKAFTGGRDTAEEQRKHGAKVDVCKVCEMLRYHYPETKKVIQEIEGQRTGKKLCGELKEFTANFVADFLEKHQKKKEKYTDLARKMVYGE